MVQSKALRPDWLPAVALSSLLALAMLVWNPQVGDLAAQVFRTELFQHAGLAIWNGSWYGGHYTLTYSFLFPPLASLLGPQLVGTISVVASSYFFDRLVRDRWGAPARWATLWFAAGVVTLLADGQLTFALGVACRPGRAALPAVRAATSSPSPPPRPAPSPARSPPPSSPGSSWSGWRSEGRPVNRVAVGAAAIALGLVLLPNLAFPESGQFPFAFSSYVAIPLFCGGALFVTRGLGEQERQLRWALIGYVAAATALLLAPNPLGGNAVRLGALFGGPVLAAVMLARRPRLGAFSVAVLALAMAGGLYWQVTASVSQIARSVGDPSTSREYFQPPAHWLRAHGGTGVRVEVPPTANHWESAYLATQFELARGWLRQLDTTRDDIFYDDAESELTAGRLPALAAAQRDLLRRPARCPARLLLGCRAPR